MLRSKMGSNDGATVKMYDEGETYDVSESLAEVFLRDKDAEKASDAAEAKETVLVEGDLYHDADDNLFVAVAQAAGGEVGLLPIEQLGDEERAELIKEGKLKDDGTALESKAIEAAPKNKAVAKAPKNKAK